MIFLEKKKIHIWALGRGVEEKKIFIKTGSNCFPCRQCWVRKEYNFCWFMLFIVMGGERMFRKTNI
uniref:Uncharacterized protein n=1 Tax=Rhizophora mucronata TaxID=61149 RepID=A0A2P2QYT9_RHIMU